MSLSLTMQQSLRSGYQYLGQRLRMSGEARQGETAPRKSIAALDGIRAVACVIVASYHIHLITRDTGVWNPHDPAPAHQLLTALLLSGFSGVTLFFVLSGFLLFLPYVRALLSDGAWPSIRLFYIRRSLRIIPAYYVTLLLLLLFYDRGYAQLQHLGDIGLFLIFFMDSTKETYLQIEGPLWTLAVEWQFYLLLPLLALGIRWVVRRFHARWRGWAIMGCLGVMMAWGLLTRYWGLQVDRSPDQFTYIPAPVLKVMLFFFYGRSGKYLEDFAVGMLLCLCFVALQSSDKARLIASLRRMSLWLIGVGLLALVGLACWNTHQTVTAWPWLSLNAEMYAWTHEWLFSWCYGVCIFAVLSNVTGLQRLFSWKPLCSLGKISYSLYMWHLPLLLTFMVQVGYRLRGGNGFIIYSLYWLVLLLLIIPFSALFYHLFEKPGIKLAAKVGRYRSSSAKQSALPVTEETRAGHSQPTHVASIDSNERINALANEK